MGGWGMGAGGVDALYGFGGGGLGAVSFAVVAVVGGGVVVVVEAI